MGLDTRKKNVNWRLNVNPNGTVPHEDAKLAVMMDIRDELQTLNRLLHCQNFTNIPHTLTEMRHETVNRQCGIWALQRKIARMVGQEKEQTDARQDD